MKQNMSGKICMVTGANRGIGQATALGLAKLGARVIMVCRSQDRGDQAKTEIISASGNQAVDLLVADLSSQASIRKLADEFQRQYGYLHVLINNAGVAKKERTLTADGLETTFAVNHMAPFLLSSLLLDSLKASAPARIINVSSMVHKWGKLDLRDLQGETQYDMDKAYNQSKLANILFTRELAARLEGTGVTANSLEPGMVATDFGQEYTGFKAFMSGLWRVFMKDPVQGAETSIYLATSDEVAAVSGQHFVDRKLAKVSKQARDAGLARQLWTMSQNLVQQSSS